MTIDIDTPGDQSDNLDIKFWLNPSSLKSYHFLSHFKIILEQFGESVKFTPIYKFKNLSQNYEKEFLQKHCYQRGEFCASNETNLNSLEILEEGLRQSCLWKMNSEEGSPEKINIYWNYIQRYNLCLQLKSENDKKSPQKCYEDAYYLLGLSQSTI